MKEHIGRKHLGEKIIKSCKWKARWAEEFPWCGPVEGNPHRVFCHSCQLEFSCDHGTSALRRHQNNTKHINNESNKTTEEKTGNQSLSIKKELETRKTYDCTECGKVFNQYGNLKTHFRIHTGEKPFKCTHCEFASGNQATLKEHIGRKHLGEKIIRSCKWKARWAEEFSWSGPVEGNPHRVFCHSCQLDFSCDHGTSALRRHQACSKHVNNESKKANENEKNPQNIATKKDQSYGCEICGKLLSSPGGLIIHRRIHSGETPYNCTYCDFVSNSGSNLKKHIRERHLREKRKCLKCDYTCNRATNLRKHAMTHIERPHRCEHCDYSTETSSSLRVHMMVSHHLKVNITHT